MMPALTDDDLTAMLLRQQLRPQHGLCAMPRTMLLLLLLSRASLWLLCAAR
jgi:hypothetical protein